MNNYELTLLDMLHEVGCMKVGKEGMEKAVKIVKEYEYLELDVTCLKDGNYLIELWNKDDEE
jgi:hypothetical protein